MDVVCETTCSAGLDGCREGERMWASKPYVSTAFESTCSVWQQNLDCPQIAKRSMMDDKRQMMDDGRQMMNDERSFATGQRPALPHYKHCIRKNTKKFQTLLTF